MRSQLVDLRWRRASRESPPREKSGTVDRCVSLGHADSRRERSSLGSVHEMWRNPLRCNQSFGCLSRVAQQGAITESAPSHRSKSSSPSPPPASSLSLSHLFLDFFILFDPVTIIIQARSHAVKPGSYEDNIMSAWEWFTTDNIDSLSASGE